jgi:hypothetical protein
MTCTKSVLISGISREFRQGYGGARFAGLSVRLLVEVVKEFRRLKATHEAGNDLATCRCCSMPSCGPPSAATSSMARPGCS